MARTPQKCQHTDTPNEPIEPIQQIIRWFAIAVPDPSEQNKHTQLGVHLEEMSEMLQILRNAGREFSDRKDLTFAADVLNYFQRQLKAGEINIAFEQIDRVALLDALCDQVVTAVGIAHMLGMDIKGALNEVAASNDSKFGEDGQPIFNEQRKIMKGPHYQSPDLSAYATKRSKKDGHNAKEGPSQNNSP